MLSVVGVLDKSSSIIGTMNQCMREGGANAVLKSLEDEMVRAGVLQEALSEGMEDALPTVDDAQVDSEVDAVLFHLSNGAMGSSPAVIAERQQAEAARRQENVQKLAAAMAGGGHS